MSSAFVPEQIKTTVDFYRWISFCRNEANMHNLSDLPNISGDTAHEMIQTKENSGRGQASTIKCIILSLVCVYMWILIKKKNNNQSLFHYLDGQKNQKTWL